MRRGQVEITEVQVQSCRVGMKGASATFRELQGVAGLSVSKHVQGPRHHGTCG
jgi:hypothetical protein